MGDATECARLLGACERSGYQLLAPIARGGMGQVWLARAAEGHATRVVAIKAMLPEIAHHAVFRAMFIEEGRIASSVVSKHVARVMTVHEDDGVLFHVMRWIDGESLLMLHARLARRGRRLPIAMLLRVLADACDGLHAAHEANVVHLDVAPANILVSRTGAVHVVDFGVAESDEHDRRGRRSLPPRLLPGRVHYVAPEHAAGRPTDARADVWAMGATLYFLLSGQEPGHAPAALPAFVPRDVAAIAFRALAHDPRDRFADAAAMRDALADAAERLGGEYDVGDFVAEHESSRARDLRAIAARTERDRAPTVSHPQGLEVEERTSPLAWAAAVILPALAVALAATLLLLAILQ